MREPDDKPGGVFNPAGYSEPTVCNGTVQMKGRAMNTQIKAEEQLMRATHGEPGVPEVDELAQSSFTAEEIAALCWRRRLVPKRWQRSHAARAKLRVPQVAGRNGQASTVRG